MTDASTCRLGNKLLTAQFDISECLAPFEQRIEARLKALEYSLEQRVAALEAKAQAGPGGGGGDAVAVHRNLQVLQEQMETTTCSIQGYLESEAVKLTKLAEELCRCVDRQSTLQCNFDDLRHQVGVDRQDLLSKQRVMSDTMELRMHGLTNKINDSCSGLGGLSTEELTQRCPLDASVDEVHWNTGVERRHSTGTTNNKGISPRAGQMPSFGLGRSPPPSPMLAQRGSQQQLQQRVAASTATSAGGGATAQSRPGVTRSSSNLAMPQQRQPPQHAQQQPPQRQGAQAAMSPPAAGGVNQLRRMTSAPLEALRAQAVAQQQGRLGGS